MKNSTSSVHFKKTDLISLILFVLAVIAGICGIVYSFRIYHASADYNGIAFFPVYDFDKIIRNLISADILLLILLSLSFFSGICAIANYVCIFVISYLNCYGFCVFYTCFDKITTEIAISALLASLGIIIVCCIASEACRFSFRRLFLPEKNSLNDSGRYVIKTVRIALEFGLAAFFIIAAAVFLKNKGS